MRKRKGVSQVLALIVAASVLMMTALTLIMMTQGGLTQFFTGLTGSECTSTIESQCSIQGGEINVPQSCFNEAGEPTPQAQSIGVEPQHQDNPFQCNNMP